MLEFAYRKVEADEDDHPPTTLENLDPRDQQKEAELQFRYTVHHDVIDACYHWPAEEAEVVRREEEAEELQDEEALAAQLEGGAVGAEDGEE